MKEVVRKKVLKWLDTGVIYPISDSLWVSPVQVVPKKGETTVVKNENNELLPIRIVTGWRFCIDYRRLNKVTREKIIFHSHLLIKFYTYWLVMNIVASWLDTQGIIRLPFLQKIKRKPPSPAPTVPSLLGEGHSAFEMHREPFKDA